MRFLKLSAVHLKYLLNKKSIIFFCIIILLVVLDLIYNTRILESSINKKLYYESFFNQYLIDSYLFIMIITIVLAIFIPALNERKYDEIYLSFCNRGEFLITEVVACFFLLFIILLILMALFLFIPAIIMIYFTIKTQTIVFFVNLFLEGCMYLVLSMIAKKIINNIISHAFLFVLFWFEKIITDGYSLDINAFIKTISIITPIMISDNNYQFLYGSIYQIINIIIWTSVLYFLYLKIGI